MYRTVHAVGSHPQYVYTQSSGVKLAHVLLAHHAPFV